jgi:hypothetical protein
MDLKIICVYGFITVATVVLLAIIIKYLKNKAVNSKFVRDQD